VPERHSCFVACVFAPSESPHILQQASFAEVPFGIVAFLAIATARQQAPRGGEQPRQVKSCVVTDFYRAEFAGRTTLNSDRAPKMAA
jgi:hypothetical protein